MMVYLFQIRNVIITELTYKLNIFFRIIRNSLILFPQIFLWKALYNGQSEVAGINVRQMTAYVVISTLIGIITFVYGANEIENKMKSGDICVDLIKPVNFRLMIFAKNIGSNIIRFFLEGIPVVIVGTLIIQRIIIPISFLYSVYFILSIIGAVILNYLIEMIISSLTFWRMSVWLMKWVLYFFILLLSGAVVPLWFLPDWMRNISELLPFQAIRFVPVAIYTGMFSQHDILTAFATQAIWIIILFVLQFKLWKRGFRRIIIMGG